MKETLCELIGILNDKQKKIISIFTTLMIIINIGLVIYNIVLKGYLNNSDMLKVFSYLVGVFDLISFISIFKISKLNISKLLKKEKTHVKGTSLGYGILESNIKIQEIDKDITAIKYNPLMLEYILKGKLILSKQNVYAQLFDLERRGIISIGVQNNDILFYLNNPDIIVHSNNYGNMMDNNFEAYEKQGLLCYENMFLSKFIFPTRRYIYANEIERNFQNGFYVSRSEDAIASIDRMMIYVGEKQNLISESSLTKLYPIVILLNMFTGLLGATIGAFFNPLVVISYILNVMLGIVLIFNLKNHYMTFSKDCGNITLSYIKSIAAKTLDNALNMSELLNLMIISSEVNIYKVYEKYVALKSKHKASSESEVDICEYIKISNEKKKDETKQKEKKGINTEFKNNLDKTIIVPKENKVPLGSLGLNENIEDQDFGTQVAEFLKVKKEQFEQKKPQFNPITQNINIQNEPKNVSIDNPFDAGLNNALLKSQMDTNSNNNIFNNFEKYKDVNINELKENPFKKQKLEQEQEKQKLQQEQILANRKEFDKMKQNMNIKEIPNPENEEYFINEKGQKVIKGQSVDTYDKQPYEAIRLDSTFVNGKQYTEDKQKQEDQKANIKNREDELIDNTKFAKAIKKHLFNFKSRKKQEYAKKHFDDVPPQENTFANRVDTNEVVQLNSTTGATDDFDTINGVSREQGEIKYDEFMDAINKYFE